MGLSCLNLYHFDPTFFIHMTLEIDRNGDGLKVLAMGHPKATGSDPLPLQNILW